MLGAEAGDGRDSMLERGEGDGSAAAGAMVLQRLHALAQQGYAPDAGGPFAEALMLRHPREDFAHKLLMLYPDGSVVARSGASAEEVRIPAGEAAQFESFLAGVPRPSVWERSRDVRATIGTWLLVVCLLATIGFFTAAFFPRLFGSE